MRMEVDAVRLISTLPARSIDAYRIAKIPSDASVRVVPVGDEASGGEPSTVYRVWATPDPASTGLSVTVTGPRCQPLPKDALSSLVCGAVASTSNSVGAVARAAPDASTWVAVIDQWPSARSTVVDHAPAASHGTIAKALGSPAALTSTAPP